MERKQEQDEDPQSSRAEDLNSLVWLYLRTVNDTLAESFREHTKARPPREAGPTLEVLYDHYQASASRDRHVNNGEIRLKRRFEPAAETLRNGRPKKKIPKNEPEIIDLTMDPEPQNDLLHPEAIKKTELDNKNEFRKLGAVQGIGCLCCQPQAGSSHWKPGKELAPIEKKEEGPQPAEPQQEGTPLGLLELPPDTQPYLQLPVTESPLRNEQEIEEEYHKMLELAARQLIPNIDAFTCSVCMCDYEAGEGVMLSECLHTFCRECLANLVRHCDEAIVLCPHRGDANAVCGARLEEREVRALVSEEDFEKHLQKTVRLAETQMRDAFHCRAADCAYWCVPDENVNLLHCPACNKDNCLKCKAIHEGEDCDQYRRRIDAEEAFQGEGGAETKTTIENMIKKKDALACPQCNIIVMKDKNSCDWVQCAICKTEICWATQGPRWGPRGHGDTSGGCGCRVNGKRCHPKCANCH